LYFNLKAIHNKDFSVVKTFKPPSSYNTGAFYFIPFTDLQETPNLMNFKKKSNPPGSLFLIYFL